MAEGGRAAGGRLGTLLLVHKHTDEVEQDLADIGIDLRDWWKPHRGPSRLTTRRLIVLLEGMWWTGRSRFWAAVEDHDPISRETVVAADIYSLLDGEHRRHPIITRREDAVRDREMRAKKARIKAREARRQRRRGVK